MTRRTPPAAVQVHPGPAAWSDFLNTWWHPTPPKVLAAAWCAERGIRTTRNPGEISNEHGISLQVPTRYVLWSPDLPENLPLLVGRVSVEIVAVSEARFRAAQAMQTLHETRHDPDAMRALEAALIALPWPEKTPARTQGQEGETHAAEGSAADHPADDSTAR